MLAMKTSECIRTFDDRWSQILVDKIVALRPHLLLVTKTVSGLAQDLLRQKGVTLVQNVKVSLQVACTTIVRLRGTSTSSARCVTCVVCRFILTSIVFLSSSPAPP